MLSLGIEAGGYAYKTHDKPGNKSKSGVWALLADLFFRILSTTIHEEATSERG